MATITKPFFSSLVQSEQDVLSVEDLRLLDSVYESRDMIPSTTGYSVDADLSPSRDSLEIDVSDDELVSPIFQRLLARLGFLTISEYCVEAKLLEYRAGGKFELHHDDVDYDPVKGFSEPQGYRRFVSVVVFLNDVDDGGELEFPKLGLSFPPQKCGCVFWPNTMPDKSVMPLTIHLAAPIRTGFKRVLVLFISEKEEEPKKKRAKIDS